MSQMVLHQTHFTIGDFSGVVEYLKKALCEDALHLFPELFLTGYPLQDLCLQRPFIDDYLSMKNQLDEWLKQQSFPGWALLGGLDYEFDNQGLPRNIYNTAFLVRAGHPLKSIYVKKLLPNYDIFDEEKYFKAGTQSGLIEYQGQKFGLLICEDMWFSTQHTVDPVDELWADCEKQNVKLDFIINLSASPYHVGKFSKRKRRTAEISKLFGAPLAYVNKVGLEDEIIFDGQSFVTDGDVVCAQAKAFESDRLVYEIQPTKSVPLKLKPPREVLNTWESLFAPQLKAESKPMALSSLSDDECQDILEALRLAITDYAKKCGLNHFHVALSGGIDSTLALTILKIAGIPAEKIEAIFMPGKFTSGLSYDLAVKTCQNLGIKLITMPIKFLHSTVQNLFESSTGSPLVGLSDENVQSRLRGDILYARSNQQNSMVINTSNKSEIAVGYSTLYGDSVGALSILGDLYKTEVYSLAHYVNKKFGNIIPKEVIERPASAELRQDQIDEQSLPPYDRLDAILEGILSYRLTPRDLIEGGHSAEEVQKVARLYQKSEYKRKQFCPIVKLKPKSFGFGRRVPICKNYWSV